MTSDSCRSAMRRAAGPWLFVVLAGGLSMPSTVACVSVSGAEPPPELSDARGITGPEPAPPGPTPVWRDERTWAAVIVIVAVAAAVLTGRQRARREPPEPPADWAAAELDRLGGGDPGSPASADALARLLREFLRRRYAIAAEGTTTAELATLIRRSLPDRAADWESLLGRCDVARFAGAGFPAEEWSAAIRDSRRLVAASLPVAETKGPAASSAAGENA